MDLERILEEELKKIELQGRFRRPKSLSGPRKVSAEIAGKETLIFCSNDYLGLAGDERLVQAMRRGLSEEGVGSGASRLISGTSPAHERAEQALADLVAMPSALLFSSGYAANLGALSSLLGPGDVVFSDRLNHASIIDGIRLSRAKVRVFEHIDTSDLERQLAEETSGGRDRAAEAEGGRKRRLFVVSDTLFSMDGDEAPLQAYVALCERYGAELYVDEAHAIGVLGEGRGLCHELGIVPSVLVGTLGKAFGAAGAFVAGTTNLRAFLQNTARSFVYSTGVIPALGTCLVEAVRVVSGAHEERERVRNYSELLRSELRGQGWRVPDGRSPIIPIWVGSSDRVMLLSEALLARGVFVQGIRPPTVASGEARLRLVATAGHEMFHVKHLIEAFSSVALEYGVEQPE